MDRGERFTRAFGLDNEPSFVHLTGFTETTPDILGLYNGENGPQPGLLYNVSNPTATSQVLRLTIAGVQLLPGVGAAYSGVNQVRMFRDPQANQLTAYASIGNNSPADLLNYEAIFRMPKAG
jgi:hypothetical protein